MMQDAFAVQNMWTSVLVQVARDLTRVQCNETAMAARWIGTYPTRDFREVCALAGLEPSASHVWFRRLCDTPFEDRRAFAQGSDLPKADDSDDVMFSGSAFSAKHHNRPPAGAM